MPTSNPQLPDEPLTRRAGAWAFVALLALSFLSAPGKVVADTKLDLTTNPIGFLARAANVWSSQSPLGQVQNQAYGYFFPHGAFFALGQFLHVPPWITQRLWWALLLFAGFWGIVRLTEALRTGSRGSRVVAATAFVLAPQVLTTLGAISSETAPVMLAPWVLLPLVQMLQGHDASLRNLAARSACAVALMGAVNAVATGIACAVAALWWLLHVRVGRGTRRFWTFSAWWAVCVALATTWWIVPLLIMGRVSPLFLEFIESSRATTQWASLPEVLRGTTSWSPFISDERAAGAMLTTSPAAVVVTGLVACAGIAGLTMRRMPERGVWATVLLVGLAGIGAGYASGLGSPFAEPVRVFLDSAGAPLRNVYKLEPFLRLPLVLGLAHLLARAPLPGTVGLAKVRRALAHPEHDRLAAGALAVVVVLALAGGMAWTGKLAPRGPYEKIPDYWSQAAGWLSGHAAGTAPGQARAERALVVPGAPFGAQLWGLTRDEPLQPLAETPWAVRDAIPLNPPGAIRALDSVQRLFSTGTPSAGLAATLRRQGISYLVLRADLDPTTSRSARPALARAAIEGSPGISEVARFGPDIAPPTVEKVVVDSGLRPPLPAITIYRVDGAAPTGPYLADLATMPRVAGGPEALLGLQADAATAGRRELGAALLASDAAAAGLPDGPLTVTDTPKRRETDYGRVDDHSSAIRTADDPRRTLNRLPDYPAAGLVDGKWDGATVSASSSAADATQLGTVLPGAGAAAAVDGDKNTAWVSSGLDHAINQWLQFTLPEPRADLAMTVTVGRALGPAVTRLLITTEAGTVYSDPVTAGTPITVVAPSEPTRWVRVTAAETADRTWGNQFAITEAQLTDARSGQAIPARHDVALPASGAAQRWVFGQDTMGRSGCVVTPGEHGGPGPVQCADIAIGPEEPGPLRRTVDGPGSPAVSAALTVRARPGQALSALLADPAAPSAFAESAVGDGRATSAAAVDGDPNTVWSAPQSVTQPTSPKPVLRLRLPSPQLVGGLTLRLPRGEAPAHPTRIGVDLGTGRQVREVPESSGSGEVTIKVDPAVTDSISISLLDWDERINVNVFGFLEAMAPGLAEVRPVGPDGTPVAGSEPAPADRPVVVPCESGPTVRVGDRVLRFRIAAGARELRDGAPVRAIACDPAPVPLPAGSQRIVASPGLAFSVDTVTLDAPSTEVAGPRDESVKIQSWTPDRRVVTVSDAGADQVLVVPESRNAGWSATGPDGTPLRAVTVNGWQQGWLVPAGTDGAVTLRFGLNAPYRIGLFGGLALLVILAALALVPGSRSAADGPVRAWQPGVLAGLGVGAVAFVLSGWPGLALWAATGLATWVVSGLHISADRRAALRVFGASGFVLAGMLLLATGPWHAEAGYVGHGPWPQGLALTGVLLMAWSTVPPAGLLRRRTEEDDKSGGVAE